MSILTLYRPNFCSACGNKIIRLRWRPWTSRKFCQSCVPLFRRVRWLQTSTAVLALVMLGFLFGRNLRPAAPPLTIQRIVTPPTSQTGGSAPISQSTIVEDDVYICGARTKKGTPCSRRVHGQVRCWQHKGLPAILPSEKLRIKA